MSIAPASPATDVDALEHLDFTPALPCEALEHDEFHIPGDTAAWVLVFRACPSGCPSITRLYCRSGYEHVQRLIACGHLLRHPACGYAAPMRVWLASATPISGGTA